ncbi:sensor histidine kinase [Flavobacterium sp.]|jgi:hypothetical protein|uniref:sensor histidine kinase n=1 Tax=Flavobacterium sp. TaxID=239 RepID=UPI0037C0BC53
MKFRVFYHLAFWSFFTFLFSQQNPEADTQDYVNWFTVLGVCAVEVYVNLYILLPKYFFRKKYLIYSLLLFLTAGMAALVLTWLVPTSKYLIGAPFFQHFVNLLVFVIVTSSFKFFSEYSQKQKALIKVENEQLKTELSVLKAQVHPHFLFNTLNNLYGLITQNENQKASEVTLKLSDLMRYLLDSSKADTVSLKAEIRFLEDYVSLEKIRLSKNVNIQFEVSGIDEDVFIPPLLFIPLVENAFKHGLNTLSEVNYAHFALSLQGNELFFEAKNSLDNNEDKQPQSGTGLANLRKRLHLIYPEKHQLDFETTETFFKVTLHLQL